MYASVSTHTRSGMLDSGAADAGASSISTSHSLGSGTSNSASSSEFALHSIESTGDLVANGGFALVVDYWSGAARTARGSG
jgi:hypothetical protein